MSGWQLASLMMPTLAQRVWPSTVSRASGCDSARRRKRIVGDRGAQGAGVVAELADLGGGLVDEAQAPAGDAHRAVLEQRIAVALEDRPLHHRIGRRQPVVPHEEVQTGRVATAHLEPVERRQRLLDGQVSGDCRNRAVSAGQRLDFASRAEPVVPNGPCRIAEVDQLGGDALVLVGIERSVGLDAVLLGGGRASS